MIKLNKDLLNKIKLVVFDLDGTILDLNNNLSESTISLVKQLKKKGLKFTIASARHISSFTNHIESLGIEDPVISLDGLIISNPFQHKIIYHSTLPAKYVKKAIDLSEKYSVYIDPSFYLSEDEWKSCLYSYLWSRDASSLWSEDKFLC